MTENRNDEDRDDWELRELFQPIRDINAPAGLGQKCLEVVRKMSRQETVTDRFPQATNARKSHLPVAIATSLMIGLSIGWTLRGQAENGSVSSTTGMPVEANIQFPNHVPTGESFDATSTVDYHHEVAAKPRFITREFYLCGVGRIQSKSEVQFLGEKQ